MIVTFYSGFRKQNNSTKQPETGTNFTCQMKDNTSIISPRISLGGSFNPANMMYCYIPAFNRYYFVQDWDWIGGAWVASLTVDALASFKSEIGATSAYITRANTSGYNGKILDGMYPATTDISIVQTDGSRVYWESEIQYGTYIVGIISGAPDTLGSVTYYTMTSAQFSALKAFLFNENFFQNEMGFPDVEDAAELLTSISPELLKTIYNPSQYIVSAIWLPIGVEGISTENVKVGWWETDATGGRLDKNSVRINMSSSSISIPSHPQAATRGDYLNFSPYTEHMLHFPPFGSVPIDPSFFTSESRFLNVRVVVDIINGKCSCLLECSRGKIAELHAQVGVPVNLSQVTPDVEGMAKSVVVHGAGGIVSGIVSGASDGIIGSVRGMIGGAKDGILNAISQPIGQVVSSGMNGSFAGITDTLPRLVSKFYNIAPADDSHKGRPVCRNATISSFSGFVQCAEGDISISGTEEERSMISAQMVNGFFYE